MQHGLLTASFVPNQEQQDLRDLTRLRVSLVQERSRLVNRAYKTLDAARCQLSAVLSDILGFSGKQILQALCTGESDPVRLAKLMHPEVKATEEQVIAALTAEVRELLELIEAQDRSISRMEAEIERHLSPFEEERERCEHINGVSRQVLYVLMDEIGTDLVRFPDAEHLSSWAGMCPGQKESAGKRLGGRERKGNRYLRAALVQVAYGVRRSCTYLGAQYRRLKKRRGSKRAALAVGQSILVIYYQMMKTGKEYHEKGEAFRQE